MGANVHVITLIEFISLINYFPIIKISCEKYYRPLKELTDESLCAKKRPIPQPLRSVLGINVLLCQDNTSSKRCVGRLSF